MKIIGNTVGTTMNPQKFGGNVTDEQIALAVEGYMTEHPIKGEKGDTGATGPQGEQGIQGEPGADGQRGTGIFIGTVKPKVNTMTVEGVVHPYYLGYNDIKAYRLTVSNVLLGDVLVYDGELYKVLNKITNRVLLDNPVNINGADGKSAYAYAQEAGYTGTETEFANKLASDSSGGVSSWNDLTDKPFGNVEILPKTTLTAPEESPGEFLLETVTIEVGKTYTIVYNGTEYSCTGVDTAAIDPEMSGGVLLGNISLLLGTGDTGEPFVIVGTPDMGTIINDVTGATSISIAILSDVVHKLDNKFIDAEWMATNVITKGTTIIEEAEYTFNEQDVGYTLFLWNLQTQLIAGNKYIVSFDGKDYVLTASAVADTVCIGNLYMLAPSEFQNTYEPFVVRYYDGTFSVHTLQAPITHTVGVYECTEAPVKLPEKYLPDNAATKEYVEEVILGGAW